MIYLLTILYTLSDVMYSKYQFINGRSGKWHTWRFIRVITFFAALACYSFFPFTVWDGILCGVLNAILFDIGINVIALHVKWNYVGSTAITDKKVGSKKWYAYAGGLVAAIVLKIFKDGFGRSSKSNR